MSFRCPDVYYQPEAFDLSPVGEIDNTGGYEFQILAVWRHDDGRLFYAEDSGCSCPTPFEDYTSLDDLSDITADTFAEFEIVVQSYGYVDAVSRLDLVRKVRELL